MQFSSPYRVEQNIEHFLDNFRITCSNSPLCTINNNVNMVRFIKSPSEGSLRSLSSNRSFQGLTKEEYPLQIIENLPETRSHSNSFTRGSLESVPSLFTRGSLESVPSLFTRGSQEVLHQQLTKRSSGSYANLYSRGRLDTFPYPYTRGTSGTYFYDSGLGCWRYSWDTNLTDSSGVSPTSPWSPVSEASSAIGTFESPPWSYNNSCWDYVMGESGCTLTVLDVADPLQSGYAYITGGKDPTGHPIITFPDNNDKDDLKDEDYKNVVTYLTSIPPLHDVDLGFVVVVDRRHGRWPSVKGLLQRLSDYFPGLLQEVLVLRPSGFLQRTFSDMGFKFVKDDFKFQVVMCSNVDDLHRRLGRDQLTEDLGGTLSYNHEEWIQHRAAIEKFSASTSQIGHRLRSVCQTLQLTEFPNDVSSTEALIRDHELKRSEVKDDLSMTIKHGEILLGCIRTVRGQDGRETLLPSSELPCNKLAHITAVERLLVQLEETQTNFDAFWEHHEYKLRQCLQLRRFEESFRHIQAIVDKHLTDLTVQSELVDSPGGAQGLLDDLRKFEADTMDDLEEAERVRQDGEQFIADDHYAVDCIRPKCLELQRICEQYKELLRKRQELLAKSRDLQDRIQRASQWCSKGVDLMSSQSVDQNSPLEGVHAALRDIEAYIDSENDLGLSDPKQVKVMFDDIITPEMKVALEQILQRVDDVRTMCEQKRQTLKKLVERPPRPIQTVHPEPQLKSAPPPAEDALHPNAKHRRSGRGQLDRTKTEVEVIHPEWDLPHLPKALDSDSESVVPPDEETKMNTLLAKQKHVMRELIETEKGYVSELNTIVEGYCHQMEQPDMVSLMPDDLQGQKDVLFGNLQQICDFHQNVFLKELSDCRDTPSLVGRCFMARKEEFQMYSLYCQNKVASDELRQNVGEENAFFKECQSRLGHKLPLGAYLLKPVQRITKYQLLLKEMLRYKDTDAGTSELQEALETMLSVLKYVNDIMHQVAITGYSAELSDAGRLLMQGSFSVWRDNKKVGIRDLRFKAMQRHIFLYDKLVMFCKKKEDPERADKASYIYKNSLQMAQVGLTESVKGDKKKFELWLHGRAEVYTIQAPNMDVKAVWVSEIKRVLLNQFDQIKETALKLKAPSLDSGREELIEPTSANTTSKQPLSESDNNYSPRGIRKSYSTDSYTPSAILHKSYSTNSTLTSDLQVEVEDDGWSSEEDGGSGDAHVQRDNGDILDFQDLGYSQKYLALASYQATEPSETSLQEGDLVEILQIGNKGWWFIRNLTSSEEGWAPATFLDCAKRCSTLSTHSTVSSGSTDSGGRGNSCVGTATTASGVTMATTSLSKPPAGSRHSISSQGTTASGVSSHSGATSGSSQKTVFISETLV